MKEFNKQQALESLARAQSSQSLHNQALIIRGFIANLYPGGIEWCICVLEWGYQDYVFEPVQTLKLT